jgi:hypothetical protein
MPFNPSPKIADCREIAKKWKAKQIIIFSINAEGEMQMATYGETEKLCFFAKKLGDVAFDAIINFMK